MQNRRPPVRGLLFERRPSAVTWLIVSIIVDAINGVLRRWWLPHVSNECVKARHPSFAYRNASSAVVVIRLVSLKGASFAHPAPRIEGFGVSAAIFGCPGFSQFLAKAAARIRFSPSEILASNNGFCPALTDAPKHRTLLVNASKASDGVSAIGRSSQINYFSPHMNPLIILSIVPFLLVGCASSARQSEPLAIPASLRQPCPTLTDPVNGTGAAVLRWSLETVEAYRLCADRHRALVEAVVPSRRD
jgi:hypothetical protein